jgi:hopanoid biosynthesis associated protein HpnK
MARPDRPRRLVVNADDFGRSESINTAVVRAHRDGMLTTASLMVNEPSARNAVRLARENPGLGVGLHLALVCGKSALSKQEIPGLTRKSGEFSNSPVTAGLRAFALPPLRRQLEDEIAAQFERFHKTGLTLDHVNGHLNFHLHPAVLSILLRNAKRWKIRAMRLTRDPFFLNARLARGMWLYRASHGLIYTLLSARSRGKLRRAGIAFTERVFGLLQNARVDEDYIHRLLPVLPAGDSELYCHPSLDEFRHELDGLLAGREIARRLGIQLIRYQDLRHD